MIDNSTTELDRLKTVLEAYGAKDVTWPADEREDLLKIITASHTAQKLLNEARALDELLNRHSADLTAPSSLMGAILQDAANVQKKDRWTLNWFSGLFLKPASGLVLAAGLGVLIGFSSPNVLVPLDEVNLDELSLSDTVLDWELANGNT